MTSTRLPSCALIGGLLLMLAACGDGGAPAADTTVPDAPTTSQTASITPPTSTGATTAAPTTTTTSPTTTTSTTTGAPGVIEVNIVVSEGEVDGPGRVTVERGSVIRLTVESDEMDEVHFHGYDVFADVAPDEPAEMLVDADIPGVFEVELEGAGIELVLIQVE